MKIMATFNTFFFDIRDLLQDSWTQNAFDFFKGDQAQNDLGFMVDQAKWVCKIGYLLSRKMKKIFTLEIQTYFGLFVEKKKREKLSLEMHFTFQIQLLDQFVMD